MSDPRADSLDPPSLPETEDRWAKFVDDQNRSVAAYMSERHRALRFCQRLPDRTLAKLRVLTVRCPSRGCLLGEAFRLPIPGRLVREDDIQTQMGERLFVTAHRGSRKEFDMNSTRNDVRDLLTAIEDRNIDEMSFAFRVEQQQWSADWTHRALLDVDLDRGDVSAVNYGANPGTRIDLLRALREGKVLSGANEALLRQVLAALAAADTACDQAQTALSTVLGVANPDPDDDEVDDDQRAAARFDLYRRRLDLDTPPLLLLR